MKYVLRSQYPTVRALRELVTRQFEDILDLVTEDPDMRSMVFLYEHNQVLSARKAQKMRRFLWGKFVIKQKKESDSDTSEEEDTA